MSKHFYFPEKSLSVAEYMRRCNAHYYATRDPFGKEGDFITAPEISQIFGELIGLWVANETMAIPGQNAVALMELGPGRGTLMKDALRATRNLPDYHNRLEVMLVETSPTLQKLQKQNLQEYAFVQWHEAIPVLPEKPLYILANEFFDALPIEQYVKEQDGWKRRIVRWEKGYGLWDMDDRSCKPFGAPEDAEEGAIYETSPDSHEILRKLAGHIAEFGGAMLIIDYGYAGGSKGDTLQAVKRHHYQDPLQLPGEADLTAHVDFDRLARIGQAAGLKAHGPINQGTFLQRLGGELRLEKLCGKASSQQCEELISGFQRLIHAEGMGSLFKVLGLVPPPRIPDGFK